MNKTVNTLSVQILILLLHVLHLLGIPVCDPLFYTIPGGLANFRVKHTFARSCQLDIRSA